MSTSDIGLIVIAHGVVVVVSVVVAILADVTLNLLLGMGTGTAVSAAFGAGVGFVGLVVLWALIVDELTGDAPPKSPQLSALRKVIDEELRKPASEWGWRGRTDRCISPSGALILWSDRSDTFNRHDLDEKVMTWAMRRARGKILKDISALRRGDKFGEMLLGVKNG